MNQRDKPGNKSQRLQHSTKLHRQSICLGQFTCISTWPSMPRNLGIQERFSLVRLEYSKSLPSFEFNMLEFTAHPCRCHLSYIPFEITRYVNLKKTSLKRMLSFLLRNSFSMCKMMHEIKLVRYCG